MSGVITTIIERINAGRDDAIEECLNNSAFFFDKYLGIGQDLTRGQQIGQLGWTNVVADTEITEEDVFRLRDVLIKFIQNNTDNRHIGLAVWSLGKLRDPSTKSELVKTLERFIDTDLNILFQAMIALDNIGENIFMNKTSRWLYDKENQILVRAYLQRQKQT